MISVTNIICIINLIAIIVLFIIVFMKNKESFTGAPTGYTNLLVSDPDGNLNTLSMETLSSDIQSIINNSLVPYAKTTDINNNYYNKTDINNNYYNKTDINNNYYNRTTMDGSFVNKNSMVNYYTKSEIDQNVVKLNGTYHFNARGGPSNKGTRLIIGPNPGNNPYRGTGPDDTPTGRQTDEFYITAV